MNYHADMLTGNIDMEENDYDDMSIPSSSEYTFTSANKSKKKLADQTKLLDPLYLKITKLVWVNDRKKNAKIEMYRTSCTTGTNIRNAVTGIYDNMRVGKLDEDMYFKVNLAWGKAHPEVTHLYYESPEQYEKHFYTTVAVDIKEKWLAKYMEERERQDKKRRDMSDTTVH